jgi:glyoxylase-like metal-dependent hydrolase (beta-lactamase superfamily II)
MYASMVEWSQAFGDAPIYLHAANQRWVMRSDPAIEYWQGDSFCPVQGISLYRCGGHFTGSTVLHWPRHRNSIRVWLS